MKKPTLCKATQKCGDCNALVSIDDSETMGEHGAYYDYYFECAFGHTKSEYLYNNFMKQWRNKDGNK